MEADTNARGAAEAHNLSDLVVVNWRRCESRLRAAAWVLIYFAVLAYLGIRNVAAAPVLVVCLALVAFAAFILRSELGGRRPWILFHAQHVVDLVAVTVGIGASASGTPALLFHLLYVLVIVPPSLISARTGLLVATGASLGHEILLLRDHGWSFSTVLTVESLAPTFLFFLVAQQCFFYAQHRKAKNAELAQLASHLQWSRERLARLVDVARLLSSTLEASQLWARVNEAALKELGADWAATFLVDGGQRTYRIVAVSDPPLSPDELACAELPMDTWPALVRLRAERAVVLTGGEARDVPILLSGGRPLHTLLLAGLYRDGDLVGILALGYDAGTVIATGSALDQLNGIVEHATIALRNAQLLDEARQASVMKSEFVSTISHELRNAAERDHRLHRHAARRRGGDLDVGTTRGLRAHQCRNPRPFRVDRGDVASRSHRDQERRRADGTGADVGADRRPARRRGNLAARGRGRFRVGYHA